MNFKPAKTDPPIPGNSGLERAENTIDIINECLPSPGLGSLLLLPLLTWILSGTSVFGHDPTAVPGPATVNYQDGFTVFPHFAIGTSGNVNYTSVLQITSTHRERQRKARLTIHGTESTRFRADYSVNGWIHYGTRTHDVDIPPLGTTTLVFRSNGPLKVGFINMSPNSGAESSDFSTSFFFQIRNIQPGELTDSVGVAPSGFGWHFVIPVTVSNPNSWTQYGARTREDVNTGIAYSHIPVTQRVQVVFELRDHTGERLAIKDNVITWVYNVWVEPYHKAQFITEIFPDFFDGREHWTRTFYGSLHIYAQRNINVLALRMDTKDNGDIQLTSVPSSGELCIDGPNRMDNCFQEDTQLDLGWVPVRNKSRNELWLEAGCVCDAAGVCDSVGVCRDPFALE